MGMNVRMRGEQSVPIIIAHRTVTKEPKVQRRRRFIGLKAGLSVLAAKILDVIHESFWTVEEEFLEAGESQIVNYAIQVSDEPGASAPELVVTRLEGRARPGCGIYCEVINLSSEPAPAMSPPTQENSRAKAVGVRPRPGNTRQNIIGEGWGSDLTEED